MNDINSFLLRVVGNVIRMPGFLDVVSYSACAG